MVPRQDAVAELSESRERAYSPLIFLSTRAAVETKKEHKVSLGKHADALLFSSGPLSQTVYEAVVDIIKREGIHGLYSASTVSQPKRK